ncbi:hypothetical protein EZV62_024037 [Acer yangbiense]|uniref:Uncharacterized protein n=1 Tax=Acer yangbiense TaxID=1000413 RepID=A0A5C7H3D9_9ROSI|nr:hypothetical protein EZV62_024037 [Acer yangbiense]
MKDCNSVCTPTENGLKLVKGDGGKKLNLTLYKQIVGSLISEDHVADIMTKPLKQATFVKLRRMLGVCSSKDVV